MLDSLAVARRFGEASFFVTATVNLHWPELKAELNGLSATEAPQITNRVFKKRLSMLRSLIKEKFGTVTFMVTSIEFQKRGLAHAHIVFRVSSSSSARLDLIFFD